MRRFSGPLFSLLLLELTFAQIAPAHPGHGDGSLAAVYHSLAEEGLVLKPLARGETPFIRLADGRRVELDSAFWRSTEHVLHLSPPIPDVGLNRKRSLRGFLAKHSSAWVDRVRQLGRKSFYVELGLEATGLFYRYGLPTFAAIIAAETLHHTAERFFPVLEVANVVLAQSLCVALQAGCVVTSQQTAQFWSTITNRQPLDQDFKERSKVSLQIARSRWSFWRAMGTFLGGGPSLSATTKRAYKKHLSADQPIENMLLETPFWGILLGRNQGDPCDHTLGLAAACAKPGAAGITSEAIDTLATASLAVLDSSRDQLAREAAAFEQIAYLNLTHKLATSAAAAIETDLSTRFRLARFLGRIGKITDRHSVWVRQLPYVQDSSGRLAEQLERFSESYVQIHQGFSRLLQKDSRPELGAEVKKLNEKLNDLANLKRSTTLGEDCADSLLKEAKPPETKPPFDDGSLDSLFG